MKMGAWRRFTCDLALACPLPGACGLGACAWALGILDSEGSPTGTFTQSSQR